MAKDVKREYVRLIENVKRGHADVYDCVVLKRAEKSIHVICCDDDNDLLTETFDLAEFIVEPRTERQTLQRFKLALMKADKKKIDAEFSLEEAKIEHERALDLFNSCFSGDKQ